MEKENTARPIYTRSIRGLASLRPDEQPAHGVKAIQLERLHQLLETQLPDGSPYTFELDDKHTGKELARNAVDVLQSYVNGPGSFDPPPGHDEWNLGRKHNDDPLRLLAIAGALIAAEYDRLLRTGLKPNT